MTRGRKPGVPAGGRHLSVVGSGGGNDGAGPVKPDPRLRPPAYLDRVGRAEYRRLVNLLEHRKLYIELFQTELARYCALFARWRHAEDQIAAEIKAGKPGYVAEVGKNGVLQPSPWVVTSNKAQALMAQIAADFGFNPVSQVRLQGSQLDLFDQPGEASKTGTEDSGNRWTRFDS